jgi:hypothetical protein
MWEAKLRTWKLFATRINKKLIECIRESFLFHSNNLLFLQYFHPFERVLKKHAHVEGNFWLKEASFKQG